MKICMITFSFPQNRDDSQCRFIYLLARELAKTNEVHVVTSGGKKTKDYEVMEGVHVHRFNYFFPKRWQQVTYGGSMVQNLKINPFAIIQLPFFFLSLLIKTIKVGKSCDIFHAQFSYLGIFALFAGLFGRKPLIVTCRGSDVNTSLKNKILFMINKHVFKKCNYITAVSKEMRRRVISNYRLSKDKIKTIPNGVETDLFRPGNKQSARKKLNLPKDRNIVLFVGHIIARKGLNYLVEAAKDAVKKHDNLLFLVIGTGGQEARIKQMVKRYGLSENFSFLGLKPHKKIAEYMSACDILVLPSLSEGRPNVVLESLASGTPTIATRVSGTPELIDDGENGFLIRPKDSKAISEKIDILLSNRKLMDKFSKKGREFIEKHNLSWSKTAKAYEEAYIRIGSIK